MDVLLRQAQENDYEAIVSLNEVALQYTSPMDIARLRYLDSISDTLLLVIVDNCIVAFLLAMRENCPYHNENFAWFSSRYSKFSYVDRIVVDPAYADLKIGSMLYTSMFDEARVKGIRYLTCEYNIDPPNKRSGFFHRKFGFREIGTQWLAGGSKQVSMQVAEVSQKTL